MSSTHLRNETTKPRSRRSRVVAAMPLQYSALPMRHTKVRQGHCGKLKPIIFIPFYTNPSCRINGLLMVAGIPQKPLSISALDILLGKYRIAGRSSGIPKNMPEAINFSHEHGIQAHMTTFKDINDIHRVIDLMNSGKAAGRFGIVLD